jgi:Uma2 family endonuclease
MLLIDKHFYTTEEYLELEINSQEKHEYIKGEITAMTGGTPNHNQIALNLAGALNFMLRNQPYQVFIADQRLWIPAKNIYTYPDIMIIHGKLQFQEGRKDTITNPLVIVEVLSKSTKNYDLVDKFAAYRTISTFHEYILIDQYSFHVEHYRKTNDKEWLFSEYQGENTLLSLNSLVFEITLKDIYAKIDFSSDSNE